MPKIKIDKLLIDEIDQQIIDTGCYQSIELLLRMGILPYSKYEQWRRGEITYLADVFTHPQRIHKLLEQADVYIHSLDMLAEPVLMQQWVYGGVQSKTGNHLKFAAGKSLLLNKLDVQYKRKTDAGQMDLFFDNQSLVIIKELKLSLIARDIRAAGVKLHELYTLEPEHEFYSQAKNLLDALVDALEENKIPCPEKEMNYLLTVLHPLAEKALSGQERDYMSLFWQRLVRVIDDTIYTEQKADTVQKKGEADDDSYKMHSSFCYQQIPDWEAVIYSIEQTIDAGKKPQLLTRLALALQKTGRREAYIQAVCDYCWQFFTLQQQPPVDMDNVLNSFWHEFLELDEAWGMQHFPAWLLIKEPGLAHHLGADTTTPEAFKLLQRLTLIEIKEKNQHIELREKLKDRHSEMLKYYLKNCSRIKR